MNDRRSTPTRVVVVDDQTAVREGMAVIVGMDPDLEVVGTAADGRAALAMVAAAAPDVVLMDLRMPHMDGVEATRRICAEHPGTAVVVLTTYDDDLNVLAALRAGALGYLTKDAEPQQIRGAVRTAAQGTVVLDPHVHARLLAAVGRLQSAAGSDDRPAQLPDGLTPREAEVLGLVGAGLTNAEIAARLVVSEATIKTHVNNLYAKARLTNRSQAVVYAHRHQLQTSDDRPNPDGWPGRG
jgi:DNA-binding NarL/FixJ family response regulator